jgi:acetyl-CoA carboxylase carboxyl transferase subunit beta
VTGADPLAFPGYRDQLSRARERTHADESVRCSRASFGGVEAVVVAFEFGFMGGSMGAVAGGRIAAALDTAARERLPVVSFAASGGCRMQEGLAALRRMQAIAAAAARLRAAGLPHVAVAQHPTTGGVWASLTAGADVIVGVAGATVAFAGRRVRGAGGGREDDPEAFTAEGQLASGQVDVVVAAQDVEATLALVLPLLCGGEPSPAPVPVPRALGRTEPAPDGWSAVGRAREPGRPHADAYLDDVLEARLELSGDRAGGRDPGMRCGVGRADGRPIAFVGQMGTATTPAGFRTAARVLRLAGRLGLPALTLVDTPGAANDATAERAGIAAALSDCFAAVAESPVPITTLVVGEGGSGGALALCSRDRLWIAPDAYFAVIAPELAAAVLKREPRDVPATAGQLALRPQDLLRLGLVDGIAAAEAPPALGPL